MKSKNRIIGISFVGFLVVFMAIAALVAYTTATATGSPVQAKKYQKYVTPAPIQPGPIHGPWLELYGENYEGKPPLTYIYRLITKPVDMVTAPHDHNFGEYLMFYGTDPKDIKTFDAEIEVSIGKGADAEKFTITSPTVLHFPPGVSHCPLLFKKIGKPIAMVVLAQSPDYHIPHEGH